MDQNVHPTRRTALAGVTAAAVSALGRPTPAQDGAPAGGADATCPEWNNNPDEYRAGSEPAHTTLMPYASPRQALPRNRRPGEGDGDVLIGLAGGRVHPDGSTRTLPAGRPALRLPAQDGGRLNRRFALPPFGVDVRSRSPW
ncbi:hypothetical protein [Streptomyces sp. NPDC127098]|uniref:hypothetical protein n=1 Tax=Streptomyces sp. NPDC127098 TaxID=3347137 RepID=UPI0036484116